MVKKEKVMLTVLLVVAVIFIVIVFLISAEPKHAPDIYFISENGVQAKAVKGGYTWNSFLSSSVADALSPEDYIYESENILLVKPGEKLVFGTKNGTYKFYAEDMRYIDELGAETAVTPIEESVYKNDNKMFVLAPLENGTYKCIFKLNYYKKGHADYGIKIIVSSDPVYDINSILLYKETYIGNASKVNSILDRLTFNNNKNGIILRTANTPYELIVKYKDVSIVKEELLNNSVALFALITNVDVITYEIEKDATKIVYTRQEVETIFERDLREYSYDADLWQKEVFYKEKVYTASSKLDLYKLLLSNVLEKENLRNIKYIALDFNSFGEKLAINDIEKKTVLNHISNYSSVVMESNLENITNQNLTGGILIYASNIEQEEESSIYNIEISSYKSEKQITKTTYKVQNIDSTWNVMEE